VTFLDRGLSGAQAGGMTATSSSPTVRRRVLAGELKNLRRSAGLTHVDVANRLGWQQGKVSKIEGAKQAVGIEAVIALAEVCHATAEHRDRLVELARAAREKGWWESYNDVLPAQGRFYVGLEAEADSVRSYAAETIPDLLQTRSYAKALLSARRWAFEWGGLERRLEVLLERQRRSVERPAVEVDTVLAESALRRMVGGERVLAAQLRHLAALAASSHVRIRVLPFSAGAVPVDSPFSILGFAKDRHPDIALVPTRSGYTHFEEITEVDSYLETMRTLESLSLPADDSIRFIEDRERELMS
jgi:transcriptional regulator with XRE-family HTH domain